MMFLDQMIISATSERVDLSASKIVGTMLKMTEWERTLNTTATRSISIYDIMKKLSTVPKLEQQELHQYLQLLSDEKVRQLMLTEGSNKFFLLVQVDTSVITVWC